MIPSTRRDVVLRTSLQTAKMFCWQVKPKMKTGSAWRSISSQVTSFNYSFNSVHLFTSLYVFFLLFSSLFLNCSTARFQVSAALPEQRAETPTHRTALRATHLWRGVGSCRETHNRQLESGRDLQLSTSMYQLD